MRRHFVVPLDSFTVSFLENLLSHWGVRHAFLPDLSQGSCGVRCGVQANIERLIQFMTVGYSRLVLEHI